MRVVQSIAVTETEARIINEFVAGEDVPTLAARYRVSEEYVDHLVDQTHLDKPITVRRKFDWSWNPWGNRLVYCVLAGILVGLVLGSSAIGTVIAVVLFVLTSAIVAARRN